MARHTGASGEQKQSDGREAVAADGRATPFWAQYQRIKAQHPDALLWTRLGDFYEMFEDDARTAARELHLTLTSREFGKDFRVPMAGVPHHAADSYLARLLRKGFHVAICEQLTEAGRGLVERDVVRVVTPGTVAEPGLLPQRANNYVAAVLWSDLDASGALAYADVTTGEFCTSEFRGHDAAETMAAELRRLAPAECLTPAGQEEPFDLPGFRTTRDTWHFQPDATRDHLTRHFRVATLDAFGCADAPLAAACAGALLGYVAQTNPSLVALFMSLRRYHADGYLQLDGQTRRNLNLVSGPRGSHDGTLLGVLDVTRSAMGARLLRRWLGQPMTDLAAIRRRQEVVAALVEDDELRGDLRLLLDRVLDVERIVGRCRSGAASPRDLWSLHASLDVARAIRCPEALEAPAALRALLGDFDPCTDVAALVETAVTAPGAATTIAAGYSAELDSLVTAAAGDRAWIGGLEQQERARTGIRSLKVGANKVFGYYIEVTNPNRALVPPDYVRKQTVAGAERYLTPELKEIEARILRAGEEIEALERRLLADLLRRLSLEGERLLAVGRRLAEIDACCALAEVARRRRWVRPHVDETGDLRIVGGRHPVVETALPPGDFIPNDCRVAAGGEGAEGDAPRLLLITGPNMAGKSTYLRQVAHLTLLAQAGSFVPAETARIGLVDRIFTRVGAHDDLVAGASTFMVEMQETASICRQATRRSLVVLDEVGRGTSTADGLAIARAVAEHLHDVVGARTLFATHFHELACLAAALPDLDPWTFEVVHRDGELSFTHKLQRGVAAKSHGLHVARLAGLPPSILERARALLRDHEKPGEQRRDAAQVAAYAEAPCPNVNGTIHEPAAPRLEPGEEPPLQSGAHEAVGIEGRAQDVLPMHVHAASSWPALGNHGAMLDGTSMAPAPEEHAARGIAEGRGDMRWEAEQVVAELLRIDVAQTTPLQALNLLANLQRKAKRSPAP